MLKKILLGLVAVVVVVFILAALQPDDFRLERKTTIKATPAAVYALVNDFHSWQAWSPWAKLDPNMETNYEGQNYGVGASYWWKGNNEVGEGRMTITSNKPSELIQIKLDFKTPMEVTNEAVFAFVPEGDQTTVTWSMTGKNGFMAKLIHLFINMDKIVGADFEKGLAQLKETAESNAAAQATN